MSGQFLFQGDFRRRPNQTLGGSSRIPQDKEALIRRAEEERRRRERERNELVALIKLQGFFRGCLDRIRIRNVWRAEFDERRHTYERTEVRNQLIRFNLFFQEKQDLERMMDMGRVLVTNYHEIIWEMKKDNGMFHTVKRFLRYCVQCLGMTSRHNVFLRLLEIYTDPTKYTVVQEGETEDMRGVILRVWNIWLDMIKEGYFFENYREFLEAHLPAVSDENEENRVVRNYDYLLLYKRVLALVLETKDMHLRFPRGIEGIKDFTTAFDIVGSGFAKSFSSDVLPSTENKGIARYYILPRLRNYISWDEWVLAMEYAAEEGDSWRHFLYATSLVMKNIPIPVEHIPTVLKVLNRSILAIDPSFAPFQIRNAISKEIDEIYVEEDAHEEYNMEMDYDEEIGDRGMPDKHRLKYLREYECVYNALKFLHTEGVVTYLSSFDSEKWKSFRQILCCIAKLEPQMSSWDFPLFNAMSCRREFMRPLCLYIIETPDLEDEDLISFCWFFSLMVESLHDNEFLSGLPISRDELNTIIVTFRELFSNRLIKDSCHNMNSHTYSRAFSTGLSAITGVLLRLHDRNSRMNLFPEDVFVAPSLSRICPVDTHSLKFEHFRSEGILLLGPMEDKLLKILKAYPFALSFHDRVKVWNRLLDLDKEEGFHGYPFANRPDVQIRRNYIYEDAFEKLSPENEPDMRKHLRISLVNVVGVQEAGIDGGGLLREFLTEATKAAVDPNRGLFRLDSRNRIYPNPIAKKLMPDFRKHFFCIGRLVGKALYEQTLLELPIAAFFLQYCIAGVVLSPVDFLGTLDPALYKNLLSLKTMDSDVSTLGLDFTVTVEELGEARVIELKESGRNISVERHNVIEYIHQVGEYKINREMGEECRSFRAGLLDVIPTLRMFSWRELQTLISGSDKPINTDDWRANTNYGDTYSDEHPSVQLFWQVVNSFDENSLRMLLKFVTSCSRPPLLGFKDLVPKFGIHSAGKTDRLPTASTCMNLLKLPEYNNYEIMKEKLLYVISAHAGFELS